VAAVQLTFSHEQYTEYHYYSVQGRQVVPNSKAGPHQPTAEPQNLTIRLRVARVYTCMEREGED
jgi:hypothetical protein